MTRTFTSRQAAGEELAGRLVDLGLRDPVVVAIPNGGVPVAEPVAAALSAPLELADVHEIGAHREDLTVGTVSAEGDDDLHAAAAGALGVDADELHAKASAARSDLRRLLDRVHESASATSLRGRAVVIVDDGVRVETAVAAALTAAHAGGAARAVLAVPVAGAAMLDHLAARFDQVVCLEKAGSRVTLGEWYDELPVVGDDEVVEAVLRQRGQSD